MSLPNDLKHYHTEEEDSFVVLTPDQCVLLLAALAVLALILWPYLS